jgi:DNA-binding NarL/FixJ family response regulator
MIRILIVDDHCLVRDGLGELLRCEPDFLLVGKAANGGEALQMVQQLIPDVVLLDICMPDINGIEATERILRFLPTCRILALSAQLDSAFVNQVFEAGARGFVHKDQSSTDLAQAIRTIMAGHLSIPETINITPHKERHILSKRERAVLKELAVGKQSREVGEKLGISPKTVDTYRKRLLVKLGLSTQAELLKYAATLHVHII